MRSPFRLGLFATLISAVAWITSVPARVVGWLIDGLALMTDTRAIRDLFETPTMALSAPGGDQVSPSLWHRNRHEAGLPRLGSARHR